MMNARPPAEQPMKASTPQGKPFMQLDPDSFVADPELIRVLSERAVPVPCDTDRLLFHQDKTS